MAIGLSLIVSATIIRDREDELMEVGLSLCITKIGQRIILWYRLLFTSDQKIYNSFFFFLEIFEIKINIFIVVWIRTNQYLWQWRYVDDETLELGVVVGGGFRKRRHLIAWRGVLV